jgi:competence protein ComEC
MRNTQAAIVLCLAYVIGLMIAFNSSLRWGAIAIAIPIAVILPRVWKQSPKWQLLLVAIAIAASASFYIELRIPQLAVNDISKFIPATAERGTSQFTIVQGLVDSYPRVTRNQNSQFWLKATQLNDIQGEIKEGKLRPADVSRPVSGRVYVTVPLQSGTGLQPGVEVSITGTLYLPQANANPGGFSFRDYLSRDARRTVAGTRRKSDPAMELGQAAPKDCGGTGQVVGCADRPPSYSDGIRIGGCRFTL